MSVHKALAQHAENQNVIYQEYLELDQQRESYIEEAIELCKQGQSFSIDKINAVTNKINRMNLRIIPTRKNVSIDMIKDFVKLSQK